MGLSPTLANLFRMKRIHQFGIAFIAMSIALSCFIYYNTVVQGQREKDVIWSGNQPVTISGTEPIKLEFHKAGIVCNSSLETDDPKLVACLRHNFLLPPDDVPYNLSNTNIVRDASHGLSTIIHKILKGKRHGVFVESRAHDGEESSSTLVLEHDHNWTGLLIEPHPDCFAKLVNKHRRAYVSPACLSTKNRTDKVIFTNVSSADEHGLYSLEVQCFPLYSFLLVLRWTTIDYFSLDVEGKELDVLKTIPWDKVDIRTLYVTFNTIHQDKDILRSYMESQGYYVIRELINHKAGDFVFAKNS